MHGFCHHTKAITELDHGGNIEGFSANAAFFPSDSIGVVVLSNQHISAVPGLVINTVADRMLNTNKTDWTKKFREQKLKAKKALEEANTETTPTKSENTKPSHNLQDYTGKYTNLGYGEFEIINQNDSLFANFKLKTLYLKHLHYDVFEPFEVTKAEIDTTESGGLRFNFTTNDVGEIASVNMKIEPALDHPTEFKHTPNIIDVDLATLERYVGDYELTGVAIKIYIKNESTLYLFVEGQPEYELLATGENRFSFRALEDYKVEFVESDDKTIKEVMMIQPNGIFKATRK